MAYEPNLDEMMFFDKKPAALELYKVFAEKLFAQFPDTGMRVQKTQITFTNPRVFACISFAKVRKAQERPREYIVVTLGLGKKVQSVRIDAAVEPHPGRWTHHILIAHADEIEDELMDWVRDAYVFARHNCPPAHIECTVKEREGEGDGRDQTGKNTGGQGA